MKPLAQCELRRVLAEVVEAEGYAQDADEEEEAEAELLIERRELVLQQRVNCRVEAEEGVEHKQLNVRKGLHENTPFEFWPIWPGWKELFQYRVLI